MSKFLSAKRQNRGIQLRHDIYYTGKLYTRYIKSFFFFQMGVSVALTDRNKGNKTKLQCVPLTHYPILIYAKS